MFITYSALSCKLATSFSVFSIFDIRGKKGSLCESHEIVQHINYQL